MKMSTEHFEELRQRITAVDSEEWRAKYRAGEFPRSEHTKDLDMRYRWDLFWHVNGGTVVRDGDYKGTHIDTALRAIVPVLSTQTNPTKG